MIRQPKIMPLLFEKSEIHFNDIVNNKLDSLSLASEQN